LEVGKSEITKSRLAIPHSAEMKPPALVKMLTSERRS